MVLTLNHIVLIFAALWLALGTGAFFYLRGAKNPAVKRQRIVILCCIAPVLFLSFVSVVAGVDQILIMIPFAALATYVNIRLIKVCQKCGALQSALSPTFQKNIFCARCGSSFVDVI
ncbi:MAG: hypothetical protein ABIR96_05525 [Bdellovibrionota bacterium]